VANKDEVDCGLHGVTPVRFACRHLQAGVACGWNLDEDGALALCDHCITRRLSKITDDITVACTVCWEALRVRNASVPAFANPQNDAERAILQSHATEVLHVRQEAAQAMWQVGLGEHPTQVVPWSLDIDPATLTFTDDKVRVVADVRFVGSFSTITDTFQWAWVTMGEESPLSVPSSRLRPFGEIRGMPDLAGMAWRGKLERAWDMTALAGYVLGYDAAFRMPQDHLYWFVLLDNFRHE
jgi:hypothetical protein